MISQLQISFFKTVEPGIYRRAAHRVRTYGARTFARAILISQRTQMCFRLTCTYARHKRVLFTFPPQWGVLEIFLFDRSICFYLQNDALPDLRNAGGVPSIFTVEISSEDLRRIRYGRCRDHTQKSFSWNNKKEKEGKTLSDLSPRFAPGDIKTR